MSGKGRPGHVSSPFTSVTPLHLFGSGLNIIGQLLMPGSPGSSSPSPLTSQNFRAWMKGSMGGGGALLPHAVTVVAPANVTAPVRAHRLPSFDAPAVPSTVIEASAMMSPKKVVPVPKVAEEPTCQMMLLHDDGVPTATTLELLAVVRVLPIWKMKVLLGLLKSR